jgi:hypothetical protein
MSVLPQRIGHFYPYSHFLRMGDGGSDAELVADDVGNVVWRVTPAAP